MKNGDKFVCSQTQSSENNAIWESVPAQGLWTKTSCLDSFFDNYNWNQDDQLIDTVGVYAGNYECLLWTRVWI